LVELSWSYSLHLSIQFPVFSSEDGNTSSFQTVVFFSGYQTMDNVHKISIHDMLLQCKHITSTINNQLREN
jgi:hypothetical protein